MTPKDLFEHLIAKRDLTDVQMAEAIEACMSGQFNDIQMATFLALMRMKGETVEELTAAVTTMLSFAKTIKLGDDLIDIVGTGGDGKNTFNVSTASSFVIAAADVKVAKHGNRSVSSNSGAADLLEQAGFILTLSEQALQQCIHECGLAFLFAPQFHPAMQHARKARQELGIRTLFNLLGPLLNPARVKRQVVGVFDKSWLRPLALVLANLGSKRVLVLSAEDGMDEISIVAKTNIVEYRDGQIHEWTLDPKDYGIHHASLEDIIVDSSADSLALIHEVFNGMKGAARDMVLLNAAAGIYCADDTLSFQNALDQAISALDNGKAAYGFKQLQQLTLALSHE